MRKILLLLLLLVAPVLAQAQGVLVTAGPYNKAGLLYVCPAPSGGTPCPTPSPIFADAGLTQSLSNPISTPADTKLTFYIAAGQYTLEMPASGRQEVITVTSGSGLPGGSPPQTQVNDPGNPGHFGGTACENFPSLTIGPVNVDCDQHNKGPNPWFDITRNGARAFVTPAQQTTASCNGTTAVTLTGAIDFINGDGIVLSKCGSATSLTTPVAPTSVTPKGILNGATTRCYEIAAEDYSLGVTAASVSTCTSTAASSFGTTVATLTTCTLSAGILTCSTSANHNFEVGETVKITGTSVINGIFKVATTPSGTSFTVETQLRTTSPWVFNTGSGGTAECPAHNWIRWTGQSNVMRYHVFRQDGGAGAFNLVGIAQGLEPFFDDYNFTAPTITNMPEVSATAPASAVNQSLAATIVSGAGTTSIVVSASASNTISGVAALHDNTQPYLAAVSAAYTARGGAVFVPSPGDSAGAVFVMNFPLILPAPSNNGTLRHYVYGVIVNYQPIVPSSFTTFIGHGSRDGGTPSFATTNYGTISGQSYPTILIPGKAVVLFDHMQLGGSLPQSWTLLVDDVPTIGAGGSTSINLIHSYVQQTSASGGLPAVFRGVGFGHVIVDTVFDEGSIDNTKYFYYSGFRLMGSSVTTPTGWPGIGHMRDVTFLGAAVEVDADALPGGTISNGGSPWTFNNIFAESICNNVFQFRNISTGNWANWVIEDLTPSDNLCQSTPIIDMTVNVAQLDTLKLVRTNGGGSGGTALNIDLGAKNVSHYGESANDTYNFQSTGSTYFSLYPTTYSGGGAPNSGMTPETTSPFRLIPPGRVFVQGSPPTSLAAVIAAGGSVPVGTWFYGVTAQDINGGETAQSLSVKTTTTTGNQTVNLTWTPPVIAPAGYNVYRSVSSSFGFAKVNNTLLTTASFSDTNLNASGGGVPSSGGGPAGISSAGVWSNILSTSSGQFRHDLSASTLTANRTASWPDSSGVAVVSTYLNAVYDNFNRANETPLSNGGKWTNTVNNVNLSSNTVVASTNANSAAFWNANGFGNDQFAQVVISTLGGAAGPGARMSANNWYSCLENSTNMFLQKNVAGTVTNPVVTPITGVAGDVVRIEVAGTTITCKQNGVVINSTTDGSLTSGSAGLELTQNTGALDNWSGGNLHPIAQLDTEQDWTQPQHFTQPVTIGATNPVAGTLTANTLYVPNINVNSIKTGNAAPTCSSTGLGTGGTCGGFAANSDDISGAFTFTAGTTAAAMGTLTLTFNVASTGNTFCIFNLANQNTGWQSTATVFPIFGSSTNQAVWTNAAVALTNTLLYTIFYHCDRH